MNSYGVDARNVSFVNQEEEELNTRTQSIQRVSRPGTPRTEYAVPYESSYYNHIEEFHKEWCYLKLRRCVFQSMGVVLQVTAVGLFGGGQCCIEEYPEAAKLLSSVGLGVGIASFIINMLSLKVDNELDKYILQQREYSNRNTGPVIIQR